MCIYFVRHGESESNRDGLCCGQGRDVSLTSKGIEQAHTLGRQMLSRGIAPEHIIHSGLQRAVQTASILNNYIGGRLLEESAFKEHNVGEWELQPWANVAPFWLNHVDPPGGETWIDFEQRVGDGLARTVWKQDAVLVAHGGTLMMALRYFGLSGGLFDNCSIIALEQDTEGRWRNLTQEALSSSQ